MNPARLRTARLRSAHARTMRVVCSWCNGLIREGDPALPTSHGLCLDCSADFDAEIPQDVRQHLTDVRPATNDSGLRGASPVPALNGGSRQRPSDDSDCSMPTNLHGG